jgi:hypothetical protein
MNSYALVVECVSVKKSVWKNGLSLPQAPPLTSSSIYVTPRMPVSPKQSYFLSDVAKYIAFIENNICDDGICAFG